MTFALGDLVQVPMGQVGTIVGFPCRLSALVRFPHSGAEIRCWFNQLVRVGGIA